MHIASNIKCHVCQCVHGSTNTPCDILPNIALGKLSRVYHEKDRMKIGLFMKSGELSLTK